MALYGRFRGRCRMSFGVGTNLTNDLGPAPLQIVLKMVRCNGQPVAKLSDTPGKTMVDDEGYLAYLRRVFGVPVPPLNPPELTAGSGRACRGPRPVDSVPSLPGTTDAGPVHTGGALLVRRPPAGRAGRLRPSMQKGVLSRKKPARNWRSSSPITGTRSLGNR